ncbi:NADH-ubiquinone oxidoreductase B18 subunit-domain-containing protein [Lyophyllum atratum]|nr:NADH-ubiquinone oxidoreductase B18 subunit-domain-containing protein [Lyophyllum atratum]
MASGTTASRTELKANQVPLAWRDHCSALLLPLNVCRREKLYMPWECDHERHTYEKYVSQLFFTLTGALNVLFLNRCQYDDYVRRMKALSKQRLAALEAAE